MRAPIVQPADSSLLGPECLPDAVLIGSGFGGLDAAVHPGVRGPRAGVLERPDAPGTRVRMVQRDGSTVDPAHPHAEAPSSCRPHPAGRQSVETLTLCSRHSICWTS